MTLLRRWWFWLIVILLVLGLLFFLIPIISCDIIGCVGIGTAGQYKIPLFEYIRCGWNCPNPPLVTAMC